jgi:hypothetical protein
VVVLLVVQEPAIDRIVLSTHEKYEHIQFSKIVDSNFQQNKQSTTSHCPIKHKQSKKKVSTEEVLVGGVLFHSEGSRVPF